MLIIIIKVAKIKNEKVEKQRRPGFPRFRIAIPLPYSLSLLNSFRSPPRRPRSIPHKRNISSPLVLKTGQNAVGTLLLFRTARMEKVSQSQSFKNVWGVSAWIVKIQLKWCEKRQSTWVFGFGTTEKVGSFAWQQAITKSPYSKKAAEKVGRAL